ncbi:MAG: hypothetical protein H3C47_10645 [Candidatus Cloacimonetes bacterium]|nr:hypothetical protein [Candidatus Cloacimonadota bacterium]
MTMQESMDLDESLLSLDVSEPVLRVYWLNKPVLSLGRFQKPELEINWDCVRSQDIECARRITGGKALLHDGGITYTIVVPRNLVSDTVSESYRELSMPVFSAISSLEPEVQWPGKALNDKEALQSSACFAQREVETVTYRGRKVVGSAQRRSRFRVLQHGEINVGIPSVHEPWKLFFGIDSQEYHNRVGYLDHLDRDELLLMLKKHFAQSFGTLKPLFRKGSTWNQ